MNSALLCAAWYEPPHEATVTDCADAPAAKVKANAAAATVE